MGNPLDAQQAMHYLALAEQANPQINGPQGATWLDRLDTEHDGLAAALQWFVEHGETDLGLRLANALYPYWYNRAKMAEGHEWFGKLLAQPDAKVDRATRAKALRFAGLLAFRLGDTSTARAWNEESLAIWSALGDQAGIATALAELARMALREGKHDEVRRYAEESLALRRELANRRGMLTPLHLLAASARMQGDYPKAAKLYAETTTLYREQGNEVGVAGEYFNMGYVTLRQGNAQLATQHFEESVRFFRERGADRMVVASLAGLGGVALTQGKPERAARLLGATEALNEKLGIILDPDDRLEFERDAADTRVNLDEKTFGTAWAEGRAMSLEQAITFAVNAN